MVTVNDGGVLKQSYIRPGILFAVFSAFAIPSILVGTASAFPGINGRIGYVGSFPSGPIESVLPDGSSPKTISNSAAVSFRWSPDGTKLAYGTATPTINVRNYDGTGNAVLRSGDDGLSNPTWSPIGDKILFTRTDGTYLLTTMNPDGTGADDITSAYSIEADWSPDGSKVVFLGWNGNTEIYTANADGTGLTRLTNTSTYEWQPRWSPDGTKILYRNTSSATYQIYTMDPDGTDATQLTSSSDHNYSPAWSPDGAKIAFTRLTDDHYDIYTMDTDGTDQTAILTGEDYVESIDWQSLTEEPSSETPNPEVISTDGEAVSVDIPALYSDVYDGVDPASVGVTGASGGGEYSVDSESGVITFTPDTSVSTHGTSILSRFSSFFFPSVNAANSQETIDYQVCSQSSALLCSSGTITINLTSSSSSTAGADNNVDSNAALADTGQNTSVIVALSVLLICGGLFVARKIYKKAQN